MTEGDRAARRTVLLSVLQGYKTELKFSTQQTYITKCVPDTLRFVCWENRVFSLEHETATCFDFNSNMAGLRSTL